MRSELFTLIHPCALSEHVGFTYLSEVTGPQRHFRILAQELKLEVMKNSLAESDITYSNLGLWHFVISLLSPQYLHRIFSLATLKKCQR